MRIMRKLHFFLGLAAVSAAVTAVAGVAVGGCLAPNDDCGLYYNCGKATGSGGAGGSAGSVAGASGTGGTGGSMVDCKTNGSCELGIPCHDGSNVNHDEYCKSGHCTDGVCCDAVCTGT